MFVLVITSISLYQSNKSNVKNFNEPHFACRTMNKRLHKDLHSKTSMKPINRLKRKEEGRIKREDSHKGTSESKSKKRRKLDGCEGL